MEKKKKNIRTDSLGRKIGRRLNSKEKEYLLENYKKMPTKELAKNLGISVKSLHARLRPFLKNGTIEKHKAVTNEELKFILDNYKKMEIQEIANKINKKKSVVSFQILKAKNNGLIKYEKKNTKLSQDEINFIINNKNKKISYIANILGRAPVTIWKIIKKFEGEER